MPTKAMSAMTAQEFVELKGALGLNRKGMAAALNRTGPTITGYENGKPIPNEIAIRLMELLDQERAKIKARDGVIINKIAGVGAMIVHQNTIAKRDTPHVAEARFYKRQRDPDTRTYPIYRMTRERFEVYLTALSRWQAHIRELAKQYGDEARQRDYVLELRDLQQLAATAPRAAPYDVCIQRNEWDVVSRALRHLSTDPAFYRPASALYCHWWKYRSSGYLSHRKRPIPNNEGTQP